MQNIISLRGSPAGNDTFLVESGGNCLKTGALLCTGEGKKRHVKIIGLTFPSGSGWFEIDNSLSSSCPCPFHRSTSEPFLVQRRWHFCLALQEPSQLFLAATTTYDPDWSCCHTYTPLEDPSECQFRTRKSLSEHWQEVAITLLGSIWVYLPPSEPSYIKNKHIIHSSQVFALKVRNSSALRFDSSARILFTPCWTHLCTQISLICTQRSGVGLGLASWGRVECQ